MPFTDAGNCGEDYLYRVEVPEQTYEMVGTSGDPGIRIVCLENYGEKPAEIINTLASDFEAATKVYDAQCQEGDGGE